MPAITSQNLWSLGVGCWVATKKEKSGGKQTVFSVKDLMYINLEPVNVLYLGGGETPSKTRPKLQSKQGYSILIYNSLGLQSHEKVKVLHPQ